MIYLNKLKYLGDDLIMAISENKKRIYISLEDDLLNILKQEAKKNRRYPSDEIAILIETYLKPKYEDEKK